MDFMPARGEKTADEQGGITPESNKKLHKKTFCVLTFLLKWGYSIHSMSACVRMHMLDRNPIEA